MKNVVTAFKEHKEFKRIKYWDANDLTFERDTYSPPHYADTIEILVNKGSEGELYVCGKRYELCGEQAFYIPPYGVHSTRYKKSGGIMTVLKINLETLRSIFDLEAILKEEGIVLSELPYMLRDISAATELERSLKSFSNLPEGIIKILTFFEALNSEQHLHPESLPLPSANVEIANIIKWTETSFKSPISLNDAAEFFGYNKNYFCKKFKTFTGVTYLDYLNTLRISEACRLLKNGMSVSDVCENCGFTNISYFIQLFKRKMGTTPKKYAAGNRF